MTAPPVATRNNCVLLSASIVIWMPIDAFAEALMSALPFNQYSPGIHLYESDPSGPASPVARHRFLTAPQTPPYSALADPSSLAGHRPGSIAGVRLMLDLEKMTARARTILLSISLVGVVVLAAGIALTLALVNREAQ